MAMIRLATTTDARVLAEVRVRSWQVGYEGIADARFLAAMSEDQNEERWREIIDARDEVIRVAAVDGRVVAFASYGPYRATAIDAVIESQAVGELYGFYVHPDSWGTGLANELHSDALEGLARRQLGVAQALGTGRQRSCAALLRTPRMDGQRGTSASDDHRRADRGSLRTGCRSVIFQPSIDSCSADAPVRRDGRTGSCTAARSMVTSSMGRVVRSTR